MIQQVHAMTIDVLMFQYFSDIKAPSRVNHPRVANGGPTAANVRSARAIWPTYAGHPINWRKLQRLPKLRP